jgi:hypothetical protein
MAIDIIIETQVSQTITDGVTNKAPSENAVFDALANKVDKETGKGLSEEDFTMAEKNKLAGIEAGAEVNVNADWNATTGDAEILNKPTIPDAADFVPYTGAVADVDLGTHKLTAHNLVVNHPSGSGDAATITKGGNGEALKVVKSSGSGNAASITGGVTLLSELDLETPLADAEIASAATWNAKLGGAVAIGQVAFGTASGMIGGDAGFTWDNVNKRLGVGTSTPTARLHVQAQGALSTDIAFRVRNSADTGDLLSVRGNGNIGINTTTDAGFKLDVNGTARVQGLAAISGETQTGSGAIGSLSLSQTWNTTAVVNLIETNITDTASSGTSSIMRLRVNNTTAFSLSKIGTINFGNNAGASSIAPSTPTNGSQVLNGQSVSIYHTITTAEGYALWIRPNSGSRTATSGTAGMFRIGETFAPTSGTAVFNTQLITPTINQTGGANGITRGLFINPTITAAADFRAIETAQGNVVFGNLPTSSAGLPTGAIWNDAGTLKIV